MTRQPMWVILCHLPEKGRKEIVDDGHFVSSPREREKRDGRDSRLHEREEQGRKQNRNESEETE